MIVLLFVSEEPKPKRKFSCKSLEDSDSKFLPIIQKKPTDLREKAAPTQQNNNKAKKADKPEREGSANSKSVSKVVNGVPNNHLAE